MEEAPAGEARGHDLEAHLGGGACAEEDLLEARELPRRLGLGLGCEEVRVRVRVRVGVRVRVRVRVGVSWLVDIHKRTKTNII